MVNYLVQQKEVSFWWRGILKLLDSYKGLWHSQMSILVPQHISRMTYETVSFQNSDFLNFTPLPGIKTLSAKGYDNATTVSHPTFWWSFIIVCTTLEYSFKSVHEWWEWPMVIYLGNKYNFSFSRAHKHLKGHIEVHAAFSWLWKSCCQLTYKIFFWLLLKDKTLYKRSGQKKKYGPRWLQLWYLRNRSK